MSQLCRYNVWARIEILNWFQDFSCCWVVLRFWPRLGKESKKLTLVWAQEYHFHLGIDFKFPDRANYLCQLQIQKVIRTRFVFVKRSLVSHCCNNDFESLKGQKIHVALIKMYFVKLNGHYMYCNWYNYVKRRQNSTNILLWMDSKRKLSLWTACFESNF